MKERAISLMLALIMALVLVPAVSLAAFNSDDLTWDGTPATLKDIANLTGYDLIDANGNYKPMYTSAAEELWNAGLLGRNSYFGICHVFKWEQ